MPERSPTADRSEPADTDPTGTAPNERAPDRGEDGRDRLASTFLLTWLTIPLTLAAIYLGHSYKASWFPHASYGSVAGLAVTFAEALLIAAPAGLLAAAVFWRRPRAGLWTLRIIAAVMMLLAALDMHARVLLDRPFLSERVFSLIERTLPLAKLYLTPESTTLILAALGWIAVATTLLPSLLARLLSVTPRETLGVLGVALVAGGLGSAFGEPSLAAALREYPSRHPLTMLALRPEPPPQIRLTDAEQYASDVSRLIELLDSPHLEDDYDDIAITRPPERTPDINIIFIESLRPDAVTPEAMPNLAAARDRGLVLDRHLSTGNCTHFSYVGVMAGVDATHFLPARHWEHGLTRLFRECGYQVGYTGNDFPDAHMRRFVEPSDFDFCLISSPEKRTEFTRIGWASVDDPDANILDADRRTMRLTEAVFERDEALIRSLKPTRIDGTFEADRPTVLFSYVLAPHYPYFLDKPERSDPPFVPFATDPPAFPYPESETEVVLNRYLNSVYSTDRLLADALARAQTSDGPITVIVGDHGQEFLESGYAMHGTAPTHWQLEVPCLLLGPGIPEAVRRVRTTHADILPTLLDAIGAEAEQLARLPGHSVLGGEPPMDRLFTCAENTSRTTLLIGPWTDRTDADGHAALWTLGSTATLDQVQQWAIPRDDEGRPAEVADEAAAELAAAAAEYRRRYGTPRWAEGDPLDIVAAALTDERPAVRGEALRVVAIHSDRTRSLAPLVDDLMGDRSPELQKWLHEATEALYLND